MRKTEWLQWGNTFELCLRSTSQNNNHCGKKSENEMAKAKIRIHRKEEEDFIQNDRKKLDMTNK